MEPTINDVNDVSDNLVHSRAGPDGFPFGAYKLLKPLIVDTVFAATFSLIRRDDHPPHQFNHAFLVCLPKSHREKICEGTQIASADNTRPFSIVDCSNGIIASILRTTLERHIAHRISSAQRSFIKGISLEIHARTDGLPTQICK